MSLGVAEAARRRGRGLATLLAVDSDGEATAAYSANFPGARVLTTEVERLFNGGLGCDPTEREEELIREVSRRAKATRSGGVDFLVGGPPCQGHSDLNNRSRRHDPRNELYLKMVRAAELFRPRVVLIENVPTVRHASEAVVQTAEAHLGAVLGYAVHHRVIDSTVLGLPQRRRRHVLLAIADGADPERVLSALTTPSCPPRTVRWAISDLLRREGSTAFDTASLASERNQVRMNWFFKDSKSRYDLPNHLRPDCHRLKEHSYKSVYGRLHWDEPAQTITTGFTSMGQGRYVHPSKARTITPHEAARLQGFPDYFQFGDAKRTVWSKLIGNAVPPLLCEAVAGAVMERLKPSELTQRRGDKAAHQLSLLEGPPSSRNAATA
jgi:DNA (cytosine-5)-methyltransferase 1